MHLIEFVIYIQFFLSFKYILLGSSNKHFCITISHPIVFNAKSCKVCKMIKREGDGEALSEAVMGKFDTNQDGKVSYEEAINLCYESGAT